MSQKPQPYSRLVRALLDADYFPRKKQNQLCCIADTKSDLVYPVPVRIEHIDYAELILGKNVKENPNLASHLVPSNILISPDLSTVVALSTGFSGMETGYGVRHNREVLEQGHAMVRWFVHIGELEMAQELQENIDYRYIF